jgi:hypothetical protein
MQYKYKYFLLIFFWKITFEALIMNNRSKLYVHIFDWRTYKSRQLKDVGIVSALLVFCIEKHGHAYP